MDVVEHPRGLFDDLANAVAGCAVFLAQGSTVELTPEYMAARLPFTTGLARYNPNSEDELQKFRVLKKLKEEGVL
jgi:hypothetical protein